jgi:hypothetical protein
MSQFSELELVHPRSGDKLLMEGLLLTIPEFRRQEPSIPGDARAYQLVRGRIIPPGVVVRLGRRIFIDVTEWEKFKRLGGKSLPGGWRREVK